MSKRFLMGRGLKAVFFDFDNTLADSASALPHAQRRVAREIARFFIGSMDGVLTCT
ncbi:MAG: hypothetical protein QW555_07500 [Nitrososphaerota archaeon]